MSGGTGWAGSWEGDNAASDVVAGGLSLGPVDGGPGALRLILNNGDARREFASPFNGNEFFFSFLFQFQVGVANDGDRALIYLNSSSGPGTGLWGFGATDFFAQPKDQANNQARFGEVVVGETYFVVARFSKSVSGASSVYDRVSLWMNPGFEDLGAPDAELSGVGQDASILRVGILTAQLEEGTDALLFDRLLGGQAWEDVVPVPEPGTFALSLLAVLALLARRWRGKDRWLQNISGLSN